ncbi:hypothetical protein BDP81DRAFT_428590 [Colletotrichum phormii]|uniref:Uncharacterized protein n=1 Tax=Colletotrichum phormii TaxID=359342 RepID=A0AAI9ZRM7_9PEZI|nr:uncharacterized protein BDP81DRAFT_428590 [Colletotrichum phormii]KAK1636904.1 hypothetical protein BDP81DRAFT_428590 [Colletotrichum phormii]
MLVPSDEFSATSLEYGKPPIAYISDASTDRPKSILTSGETKKRHTDRGATPQQTRPEQRSRGSKSRWLGKQHPGTVSNAAGDAQATTSNTGQPLSLKRRVSPQLHCASWPHTQRPITNLKTLTLLCRCATVLVSALVPRAGMNGTSRQARGKGRYLEARSTILEEHASMRYVFASTRL